MHSSGGTWKLNFCLSGLPEDLGSVLLVTSICKECVIIIHFCLVVLILSFSLFYFVLALSTGQLFFTIFVLLIISYDVSAYWQMLENSNYDCSCLKLQTTFLCGFFFFKSFMLLWGLKHALWQNQVSLVVHAYYMKAWIFCLTH